MINRLLYLKIFFILILGISPFCHAKSQSRELDSLKNIIKNNTRLDTNKVKQLNDLAYKIYPFNLQELRLYSDKALTLALKLNYKTGEAVAYKNLALSFMLLHGDATSLLYLDKALNILKPLKDSVNTATVLNYIGCYYATIKDDKRAIGYFLQALNKLKGLDKHTEFVILNNAGNYYEGAKQLNKAGNYYSRMLSIAHESRDANDLAECFINFASLNFTGNNYSVALDFCNRALSLSKSTTINLRDMQEVYILLGDINYKLKRYNEARSMYLKSAGIGREMKSGENMERIYHDFYLLDSLKGDFRSAIKNFYKYAVLKDSLINLDKTNVVALYQVKFDVERREEENKQLKVIQEKNSTIIARQRTTLIVAIFSLLVIGVGFFYLKGINKQVKAKNKVINEQNKQLENSNNVKDIIFSVISHDLRNPISQVIGLLSLLEDGDMTIGEIISLIPSLKNTSLTTLDLLDNLLIWSKNQLQGFSLNPVIFNMGTLVNSITKQMQTAVNQKQITVTNNITGLIMVSADEEMIAAVIRNLLSNAVKFTPAGGAIQINGTIADDLAIISVADTGIGISEKDQHKIFSFATHTTLGTAQEKGTGIGLKICSDFISLNNGTIRMTSKENAGSTFFISLPTIIDVNNHNEKLVML